MKINSDGSVQGKPFSKNYSGKYPHPLDSETYGNYYKRVRKLIGEGFHLGDLSWSDWSTYCLGSPAGGGESVQDYKIGNVPDWYQWTVAETNDDDEY